MSKPESFAAKLDLALPQARRKSGPACYVCMAPKEQREAADQHLRAGAQLSVLARALAGAGMRLGPEGVIPQDFHLREHVKKGHHLQGAA